MFSPIFGTIAQGLLIMLICPQEEWMSELSVSKLWHTGPECLSFDLPLPADIESVSMPEP